MSSGFFSLALGCAGAADPSLPPGDGTPASTGATAQELLASAKSVRAPAQSRSRWSPALNWDDDRTFSHNQPIRLTVLQPGQKSKPGLPQPLQFIQAEEPTLRNKQEHVSLTPGAGLHIHNKCNKTFVPWGDIVLELLIYVAILISSLIHSTRNQQSNIK